MVMYVGESIEVHVRATKPTTGRFVTGATAIAEFFAPDKDPVNDVDTRADPDTVIPLAFDEGSFAYTGVTDTGAWEAGRWTVRAVLSDAADAVAFSTFTLHA